MASRGMAGWKFAAAPTKQPLVDAGGTIWQLFGGTWATLIRGQEPLPGTAPFYPL